MYVSSRGWILFLTMSTIWGIPYLMIKVAVEGVSVPVLVLARTAVGAAVLVPLAFSRQTLTIVRSHWKALLGFAFFEIIAAWWLLSDAERHLTSSMTGLLIAASPIIAAVLDRFTGGERLGYKRVIGLTIGICGVGVLAGPHIGSSWPIIEVLMVATCYAIAPLIAARYLADVPALPMTAVCLGFAALVFGLAWLLPGFVSILVLDPDKIRHGEVWRLVTYIFIPQSLHPLWVIFALWFLWWVGEGLERAWGSFRLTLYILVVMIGTTAATAAGLPL